MYKKANAKKSVKKYRKNNQGQRRCVKSPAEILGLPGMISYWRKLRAMTTEEKTAFMKKQRKSEK